MKVHILCIFLVAASSLLGQVANRAVLTLGNEPGFNAVDLTVDVAVAGDSSDTIELTGTITIELAISPQTGQTSEFTIIETDVSGSDITLESGNLLASYALALSGLRFDATTPNAPGAVNPNTGEFNANEHLISANEGNLTGFASSFATGREDVAIDFSNQPFGGPGIGTGRVILTPGRVEAGRQFYSVIAEIPVSFLDTLAIEGVPISPEVTANGTINATGETFVELDGFENWAARAGLTAQNRNTQSLSPLAPNFLIYSLGYPVDDLPTRLFEFSADGVTLQTGSGTALGDLIVEWSDDLTNWDEVPLGEMLSGSASISTGDSLETPIIIARPEGAKFYRISAPPASN